MSPEAFKHAFELAVGRGIHLGSFDSFTEAVGVIRAINHMDQDTLYNVYSFNYNGDEENCGVIYAGSRGSFVYSHQPFDEHKLSVSAPYRKALSDVEGGLGTDELLQWVSDMILLGLPLKELLRHLDAAASTGNKADIRTVTRMMAVTTEAFSELHDQIQKLVTPPVVTEPKPSESISPARYGKDTLLRHHRGGIYSIIQTPDDGLKLSDTAEPAYSYTLLYRPSGAEPTIWVRKQTDIENEAKFMPAD